MKHLIGFLIVIFGGLFIGVFFKQKGATGKDEKPVLRVFGPSSFVSQWGPGPWLKQSFEKTCECRVEFVDGADVTILLQRLKSESKNGTDLILGLDQFEIENAGQQTDWQELTFPEVNFVNEAQAGMISKSFIPYDWGLLAFVLRSDKVGQLPTKLDDLLEPQWKEQISLQDPRTSSPGLQFLLWVIQAKGEDSAFQYLKNLNKQAKTYASSWSSSYGLFKKSQVLTTFSYATSPVYHLLQEQDSTVVAAEFVEGHPVQYEYLAIPKSCKQCELAKRFSELMLSPEGQKVIMEKNYMFPVVAGVKDGTAFGNVPPMKTISMLVPSASEKERILKRWSQLRRQD